MNNGKIFLIDDERAIRLTFRLALETDGYEVREAASAAEAMKGFEAERYDLAVLDLRLGEDNGLELLAKVRLRGIQTPTLMITAHGSIRNAVRAMQLGAIDFLKKPVEPAALRAMVAEAVGRHQPPARGPAESWAAWKTSCARPSSSSICKASTWPYEWPPRRCVSTTVCPTPRTCRGSCTRSWVTTPPPNGHTGARSNLTCFVLSRSRTCGESLICSISGKARGRCTSAEKTERLWAASSARPGSSHVRREVSNHFSIT